MSTSKDTIAFILKKLGNTPRFTVRAMFGEYALYADMKTVALVCDDLLYVKICSASASLQERCEEGPPYPGAKQHYIVTEEQLVDLTELPDILLAIASSLPAKRQKIHKALK
ncbi:MAG: TfoX/Sxy family protein [Microgenomates group bacterium]